MSKQLTRRAGEDEMKKIDWLHDEREGLLQPVSRRAQRYAARLIGGVVDVDLIPTEHVVFQDSVHNFNRRGRRIQEVR